MLRPWARSKKLRRACGGNPREACTRHIGRSGSKTRCGWAKRTSSPIAGPGKVHAPVPPTINGPNRLICLVRSVPNVEPAPPSCCRLATAKPCSSISTRSQPKSPSERTPLSSLIRPDGMAPKPWWFPTTSHSCRCRRAHLNSTARKTSGSSCARIGCQTGFSNPSTISSTTAATLGTHSSTNPGRLCPSRDATGQKSVTQSEDWYKRPLRGLCPPYDGGVCCASFQLKLRRQAVFGGERSELVPGAVFHVDAALGSLLRAHVLDFAGIEYARTAGGGRRGFEIACEIRHPLFELGERPERCHVEHRHEATVVVPAARLDTETQPSEQTTQHLDHRREPAALVALGAAHRQQRATLAQLRRVGGLPAVLVDDPPGRDFLAACDRQIDLAGRDRGRRHVQTKGTVYAIDVSRDGDDTVRIVADQIGLNAAACDGLGLLGRGASRAQERDADFLQAVGSNRGHFLALPFFCAVSDRRRGRIAAARPRARPRRPHGRSR